MERLDLRYGESLSLLKDYEDNSIDSLVTDPPAGISFMGKHWDDDFGGMENWIVEMAKIFSECLRVLKPGAHGLVWSLPKTSHWTALALHRAGFEIRDKILHVQGMGFPKSLAVDKAIKKQHGEELAKQWEGWGTGLKPAVEEWVLIRKTITEKNIAENVLKWGTGGINIDGCRIKFKSEKDFKSAMFGSQPKITSKGSGDEGGTFQGYKQGINAKNVEANIAGRFPSNFVLSHHDECETRMP